MKQLMRINCNINNIKIWNVCAYYRSVLEINMVFWLFPGEFFKGHLPAEETPLRLFSWDFHRFLLPPGLTY